MTTGDFWELAGSAGKLLSLLAIAGVLGGGFILGLAQRTGFRRQPVLLSYLLASAVFGLFSTLLYFLLQVGAINQSGIAGMLDTQMALIIAKSDLGLAIGSRLLGFLIVIPAFWLFRQHRKAIKSGDRYHQNGFLVLAVAVILLCGSFALTGHTSTLMPLARTAIVLHVLAVFLWIGSLYPLLHLSTAADISLVQRLMQHFGTCALLIVAMLLVSGIYLMMQLLQSFSELMSTQYGRALLVKLTFVACLLALAGLNKLLLVPRLGKENSVTLLKASIRLEIVAAICVITVTTWLSSGIGPTD